MTRHMFQSPLDGEHALLGARMRDDGLVASYDTPSLEADAARGGTVLCDISACGKIRVAGRPAAFFLEGMIGCDMQAVSELGQGMHATFDMDGDMARAEVIRSGPEEFMLLLAPTMYDAAFRWLFSHADAVEGIDPQGEEGMAMSDESGSLAALFIAGPDAVPVLSDMLSEQGELPSQGTISYEDLDGHGALVYHMPKSGSYVLLSKASAIWALWRGLLSFPEITPIGMDAYEEVFC